MSCYSRSTFGNRKYGLDQPSGWDCIAYLRHPFLPEDKKRNNLKEVQVAMEIFPLFDSPVLACPMCLSGADGQQLIAANSAILLLLVVLVGVLMAFFSFIIYLVKRAKRFGEDQATNTVRVDRSKN